MSDRCDAPVALRAAAAAHQPDRERMLARVERGMRQAEGHPRLARAGRPLAPPAWARVAGAVVALAVTLGVASAAVAWTTAETPPQAGVGPAGGSHPDREGAGSGGQDGPAGQPSDAATGPDGSADSGGSGQAGGAVTASGVVDPGSNPYWSQSNVTVAVPRTLTSFTLELRVAMGEGVRATGAWRTLPSDDFELTMEDEGDELVFRWELREGAEIPPGEHVFAGQYDHDGGPREADGDSYLVRGNGPGGEVSTHGGFA
ncbi:hypothetical protein ACTWP5_23155 [Streptomyces sp. 4N509B]|uniref:hypothetical protein n=1 Tax=Streptomyces sp. 4N509B TaxID=3457413 RepID=UPI003FD133D2